MARNKLSGGRKKFRSVVVIIVVMAVFAGIPFLLVTIQSKHSGLSAKEIVKRITNKTDREVPESGTREQETTASKTGFLDPVSVGFTFSEPPFISHVQAVDLDKDGLLDIVVCDSRSNSVNWIRQFPAGNFAETILADELIAPAHIQMLDFEGDSDNDLMIAVLGMLFPNNDKIGSVVILENDGNNHFRKHLVADKIARVSDVRAGDLDNDGDNDLAVAQFGYDDGETRWIENMGTWKFKNHILQNLSGPVNVEILDIDRDEDNDIISLVTQEWEEIYCFINDGKGNFQPKLLYGSSNQDFGSSGIFIADLDQDDDVDILYTNGDAFDYIPPQGRPWHGIQWLENKGNMVFEFHRLCNFTGAYNARPVDIDKDGDFDIFAVSAFNLWEQPESKSFIWLENNGSQEFLKHEITNNPTHLLTLETGDFNNDGLMDMVTGGMHIYPPYDRMSRILLWINNGKLSDPE